MSRGYGGCLKKSPTPSWRASYSVVPSVRGIPRFVLPNDSEVSLASFGTASPGRPLACAWGDKKVGSGREPFSVVSSEARNLHTLSCPSPCSAKSSEPSLTSFGTASPGRPLACARGDKKSRLGATKKVGSGRQKGGSGRLQKGLHKKHS